MDPKWQLSVKNSPDHRASGERVLFISPLHCLWERVLTHPVSASDGILLMCLVPVFFSAQQSGHCSGSSLQEGINLPFTCLQSTERSRRQNMASRVFLVFSHNLGNRGKMNHAPSAARNDCFHFQRKQQQKPALIFLRPSTMQPFLPLR